MKYESPKTERGNIGVSFSSMESAINQAEQMDKNDCNYCYNCNDCNDCNYCSNCYNCKYCNYCYNCNDCNDCKYCNDCYNCKYCNDCNDCSNCKYCSNCSNCYNCYNCKYCSNCYNCKYCKYCYNCNDCTGILRWEGNPATKLIAINGLTWPVTTDYNQIQIGCQLHTVELWENFSAGEIDCMDTGALEFWTEYKTIIIALAKSGTKIPVTTKPE